VRTTLERIARAGWPVLAGVLLGLLPGGIWTLAQPERYRAETRVLVRGPARGLVPAVRALAESSLLEQNVAQTLRLSKPPSVSASAGEGGVLTLSVEAGSRDRARQLDAEAALVLGQLVRSRFGTSVETTVLDPAHTVEQTSPTPERNLLIGGLIGLALGSGAAVALGRRRPIRLLDGAVDPSVERRLRARIDTVAKRERALARRAGALAQRESLLGRREAAQPERQPEPEPEPEPAPEPELEPVALRGASGRWSLDEIERRVRERGAAFPERVEEWNSYLFFLREHAGIDGGLPPNFDPLVSEVFEPLLR
jgi:hypothetical protein